MPAKGTYTIQQAHHEQQTTVLLASSRSQAASSSASSKAAPSGKDTSFKTCIATLLAFIGLCLLIILLTTVLSGKYGNNSASKQNGASVDHQKGGQFTTKTHVTHRPYPITTPVEEPIQESSTALSVDLEVYDDGTGGDGSPHAAIQAESNTTDSSTNGSSTDRAFEVFADHGDDGSHAAVQAESNTTDTLTSTHTTTSTTLHVGDVIPRNETHTTQSTNAPGTPEIINSNYHNSATTASPADSQTDDYDAEVIHEGSGQHGQETKRENIVAETPLDSSSTIKVRISTTPANNEQQLNEETDSTDIIAGGGDSEIATSTVDSALVWGSK